jgi:hypothetical protein
MIGEGVADKHSTSSAKARSVVATKITNMIETANLHVATRRMTGTLTSVLHVLAVPAMMMAEVVAIDSSSKCRSLEAQRAVRRIL